uniref:Uncharacterized protein n=1 Tax=Scleropages formosus TaxID=113540 RepID=A0A8C9S821_SCLFO
VNAVPVGQDVPHYLSALLLVIMTVLTPAVREQSKSGGEGHSPKPHSTRQRDSPSPCRFKDCREEIQHFISTFRD